MTAVCIRCGCLKRGAAAKCTVCQFRPDSAEDKAKSLILSTAYEIDGDYRGKTTNELKSIALSIANGHAYHFAAEEVRLVVAYAESVMSMSSKRLMVDGLRWLLLPMFILFATYLVLFY